MLVLRGFGFAIGPYLRLALWGKGKQGGFGLAPYFALQSLKGGGSSYMIIWLLQNETGGMFAVGLLVNVLLNKLFVINCVLSCLIPN